ncbi:hypothetical protein [Lysinibacillus fusiformis]|uniref:hypothetical protein n=1 Tax=Lysinibacillus fusiformis TaxID=28031 RepID=UPI0013B44AB2|nr:hypothetical protein [Lysinibacillus fusiformis]
MNTQMALFNAVDVVTDIAGGYSSKLKYCGVIDIWCLQDIAGNFCYYKNKY